MYVLKRNLKGVEKLLLLFQSQNYNPEFLSIPWICWTNLVSARTAKSFRISSFMQLEEILQSLCKYHSSSSGYLYSLALCSSDKHPLTTVHAVPKVLSL